MTAILRVRDADGNIIDIPSIKGKDGYTPVKGVDYFTQVDIDEIVANVVNAFGDGDSDVY